MPNHQGRFDGLCGMYSIANALEFCDVGKAEHIFQTCCHYFASDKWPDKIWSGTTFTEMQGMIKFCQREIKSLKNIRVDYPFRGKNTPRSDNEYWQEFDRIFEEKSVQCAIMGITRPSWHWLVSVRLGDKIAFLDSAGDQQIKIMDRDYLYAGSRQKNHNVWKIDRSELITFSIK